MKKILHYYLLLLLCLSASVLVNAQPPNPNSGWNITWNDEFDGSSINTGKWTVFNSQGGRYRPANVSVGGGLLKIKNIHNNNSLNGSTGGRVDSKLAVGPNANPFYYEARVKITFNPNGKIWPTWWIWGGQGTTELDMMEYSGFSTRWNNNGATSSHHYRNDRVLSGDDRTHTRGPSPRNPFGWHTYGVYWARDAVIFYFDGVEYLRSKHPEDAYQENRDLRLIFSTTPHIKLNNDFQADTPLAGPANGEVLPEFHIAWVRVWTGGQLGGGSGGGGGNPGGNPVVTMKKGNAQGFGIDGNNGGANGQNVYLWSYNANNVNQQWVEINRGNSYYSYQKRNTNYCLDGGNGGGNGQNVYLWTCNNSNQNQHWKKVNLGGSKYRLEKRNASGFSIDGNVGGSNGQNLYLWSSNNSNPNQQWIFTNVGP